jgi:hypothetical protein
LLAGTFLNQSRNLNVNKSHVAAACKNGNVGGGNFVKS